MPKAQKAIEAQGAKNTQKGAHLTYLVDHSEKKKAIFLGLLLKAHFLKLREVLNFLKSERKHI